MRPQSSKVKVVITDLSNRISYYQWFVYGFMLLEREGKIRLKFKVPVFQRLFLIKELALFTRIYNKIERIFHGRTFYTKTYLKGYVEYGNEKHTFCLDSDDSPNMFCKDLLKTIDVYFKLQCPKVIEKSGFKLGHVYVPYFDCTFVDSANKSRRLCPEVFDFQYKIKPLMIAVRSMGRTFSFKELDSSYHNLLQARKVKQSGKIMCYFGNAKGPKPTKCGETPDFNQESDIMGYFGNKLNHPNEKRAKVADILKSLGEGYDARIINNGNSDQGESTNKDLIIPLKDFSKHVAKFQYNVNVSGYRMSIPARFIDSFICGTAIVTDNLAVKWYHSFGDEVYEIGEMGYLPDSEVDYDLIKKKLASLKSVKKEYVIDQYERFWSPKAVANHIIETVLDKSEN